MWPLITLQHFHESALPFKHVCLLFYQLESRSIHVYESHFLSQGRVTPGMQGLNSLLERLKNAAIPFPQAVSPRCHLETWHTSPSSCRAQHTAYLCLPFPAHLAWLPGPFPSLRKCTRHSQYQRKRPFKAPLLLLNQL